MNSRRRRGVSLPKLLKTKIYKTGQTRGADDDSIYQNRVLRTGTVLIPYEVWTNSNCAPPQDDTEFENGFIVLLAPEDYFENADIEEDLQSQGLSIGENALVFYQIREHWQKYHPSSQCWLPAQSRKFPLGGQYVTRIPATTSVEDGGKIIQGFSSSSKKGAGIRLYEYASPAMIEECRLQLELIYWLCKDSLRVVVKYGMSSEDALSRKIKIEEECKERGLYNIERMSSARIINQDRFTVCPLCLEELPAEGFFTQVAQAEGRKVHDLTVTQVNLFHIEEVKYGEYNHRKYNLGWGHHHCNVVVKDNGISETLEWMQSVIQANISNGYLSGENKSS